MPALSRKIYRLIEYCMRYVTEWLEIGIDCASIVSFIRWIHTEISDFDYSIWRGYIQFFVLSLSFLRKFLYMLNDAIVRCIYMLCYSSLV